MTIEQLRPIRLEIALALVECPHLEAKKILSGLAKTDPVIEKILNEYGVVV